MNFDESAKYLVAIQIIFFKREISKVVLIIFVETTLKLYSICYPRNGCSLFCAKIISIVIKTLLYRKKVFDYSTFKNRRSPKIGHLTIDYKFCNEDELR